VIRDDDADYSFLIKQCSSRINCCSAHVWFAAIRPTVGPAKWPPCGRRKGDHGGMEVPANCVATGGLADGAAPAKAVGTDNTPTEVA
jgi:hypothetical protein